MAFISTVTMSDALCSAGLLKEKSTYGFCSELTEHSKKLPNVPPDRIKLLYPTVDETEFPIPRQWSSKKNEKYIFLGLSNNDLRVKYKGNGKDHKDAASIRTTIYIPTACGIYYYEVKVISKGRDGYMGIGLTNVQKMENRLPGWDKNSFGYHGDDGNSFSSSGQGKPYGPTFTSGDVIGCCINFIENTCFYTKNGINLGIAFKDLPSNLYPTIGLQTPGEEVEANFGQEPFVFDFEDYVKEWKQKIKLKIDNFQLPPSNKTDWQADLQKVVISYLMHEGYSNTAEAFSKHSGHRCQEEITSVKNRQRLQRLVMSGKIGRAVSLTRRLYPSLFEKNSDLLFRLKCRQFVEMVNGTLGDKWEENDTNDYFDDIDGSSEGNSIAAINLSRDSSANIAREKSCTENGVTYDPSSPIKKSLSYQTIERMETETMEKLDTDEHINNSNNNINNLTQNREGEELIERLNQSNFADPINDRPVGTNGVILTSSNNIINSNNANNNNTSLLIGDDQNASSLSMLNSDNFNINSEPSINFLNGQQQQLQQQSSIADSQVQQQLLSTITISTTNEPSTNNGLSRESQSINSSASNRNSSTSSLSTSQGMSIHPNNNNNINSNFNNNNNNNNSITVSPLNSRLSSPPLSSSASVTNNRFTPPSNSNHYPTTSINSQSLNGTSSLFGQSHLCIGNGHLPSSNNADYLSDDDESEAMDTSEVDSDDYSRNGADGRTNFRNGIGVQEGSNSISLSNGLLLNENVEDLDKLYKDEGDNTESSNSSKNIEMILKFGKELKMTGEQLKNKHGTNETNKKAFKDAISLLAYTDPWNSPIGYQLNPMQREAMWEALNTAILEQLGLPKHSPLEVSILHAYLCLKLMSKAGIPSNAFASLTSFI